MRITLLACAVAIAACGGGKGSDGTPDGDHGDEPSDADCVVDTCGVCDGDGSSCTPQAEVVIVLQVEGATLAVFPFVKGLGSSSTLVTVNGTQTTPGKVLPGNVTLVRQATEGLELTQWREAIEGGSNATQTATLTLSDSLLGTIAKWELMNAWPSAIDITQDASGLRETVVITHDGGRRLAP